MCSSVRESKSRLSRTPAISHLWNAQYERGREKRPDTASRYSTDLSVSIPDLLRPRYLVGSNTLCLDGSRHVVEAEGHWALGRRSGRFRFAQLLHTDLIDRPNLPVPGFANQHVFVGHAVPLRELALRCFATQIRRDLPRGQSR